MGFLAQDRHLDDLQWSHGQVSLDVYIVYDYLS